MKIYVLMGGKDPVLAFATEEEAGHFAGLFRKLHRSAKARLVEVDVWGASLPSSGSPAKETEAPGKVDASSGREVSDGIDPSEVGLGAVNPSAFSTALALVFANQNAVIGFRRYGMTNSIRDDIRAQYETQIARLELGAA
jgi:hypothetical protein